MSESFTADYNHHIFTHFDFSKEFEYVKSLLAEETLPEVIIYKNKLTGKHVAVSPLLSPDQIGRLHRHLLTGRNDPKIDKFYYSSYTPLVDGDTNTANPQDIQVLVVIPEKPIQLHYDVRSHATQRTSNEDEKAYTSRINVDITNTYGELINACGRPTITKNPYGTTQTADTGDQLLTPLIAMTGKVSIDVTDEEKVANLNRRIGRLISDNDLQLLKVLYENNKRAFSMDAVFTLNPEKSYFYLVGLLLSALSGFENLVDQGISISPGFQYTNETVTDRCAELESRGILADPHYTGDPDSIPEIGRVFYNPITGKSIAIMAPGYDELDDHTKDAITAKCDHVIKMDISSGFSQEICNRLKELGFGIMEIAQLFALIFEETPTETHPLRKRATNLLSSFATSAQAAADESFDYTTPVPSHQPSPERNVLHRRTSTTSFLVTGDTPARSAVCPSRSPRRNLTQDPVALEKAHDLVVSLNERLTTADYYASLNGLLLLNGYKIDTITPRNMAVAAAAEEGSSELSRQLSRTINEGNTTRITLHKPCSLEEAIRELAGLLNLQAKQIYLTQEDNKPLRVLYFDGTQTRLYTPETSLKNPPWGPPVPGETAIGEPPITITTVSVTCPDYSFEHNVFHALHQQLVTENVITANITRPNDATTADARKDERLQIVKSCANFSAVHTPDNQKVTLKDAESASYSLLVNTKPSTEGESVMVAAYRQIVENCYEMGMTLISRVADDQYHDLAFIFQQAGSDRYFIIRHPTHPTTIQKEALKEKVVAELTRLQLPIHQLDVISFADDPPKYSKVTKLPSSEMMGQTILEVNGIKTLYDVLPHNASTPETRANLHFKQWVNDYLQKGYAIAGCVIGQHEYRDAQGITQTVDYTQAVIFRSRNSNEGHIITHPYHRKTVSKAQLDSAVELHIRQNQVTGLVFLPKRYFKDDREISKHVVTLQRTDGPADVKATHSRTEVSDQKAQDVIVNGVMAHMGYVPHNRAPRDTRPPYKLAEPKPIIQEKGFVQTIKDYFFRPKLQPQEAPTEKPFWNKGWWQKTKEHFQRHRGKYEILAGLAIGGLVGSLTFGLGLIPIAIGAAIAGGVGGGITLWGGMSAKKDYDETKESEQAIKLIERQCSSTLGIMRQLELTSENGLSIAPAPSSVGSSLRWPAGGERLRYDLDPPSSTRLPNGLGLLEETDVGVDPNADKRSERSFTTA